MNSFSNSDQADFDKIASGLNKVDAGIKQTNATLKSEMGSQKAVLSQISSGTQNFSKTLATMSGGPVAAAVSDALSKMGPSISKNISGAMNSLHGHGDQGIIQAENLNAQKIVASINGLEDSLSGKANRFNGSGGSAGRERPLTASDLRAVLASMPQQAVSNGGAAIGGSPRAPGSLSSIQGRVNTGQQGPADVAALLCELIKTQKEFSQNFTDPNAKQGGGILSTLWDLGKDLTGINILFSGRYAKDIKRSTNPLETMTDALIKIYEWERIGIDLSRRQLNEIIKATGGKPQKYVGHEGVMTTIMKRGTAKLKNAYDESALAKIPILGKLGKGALNVGSFFMGFNEEDWRDQMMAKWYNGLTSFTEGKGWRPATNKQLNNEHRVNQYKDAVFGADVDYSEYGKTRRELNRKFKAEDTPKFEQVMADPEIQRSINELNAINQSDDLSEKERKKLLNRVKKQLKQSIKAAEEEYGVSGLMEHITEVSGLGTGLFGTGHSLFGKWFKPDQLDRTKTYTTSDFLSNSVKKEDDNFLEQVKAMKKQYDSLGDDTKEKHELGLKLSRIYNSASKELEEGKKETVRKVGDSIIPVTIVEPNQLILSALRSKIKGVPKQNFEVFKDQLQMLQNIKDILEGKGSEGGVVTSPTEAAEDAAKTAGETDVEDVEAGSSSGEKTVEEAHLENEQEIVSLLGDIAGNTKSLYIPKGKGGDGEGGFWSSVLGGVGGALTSTLSGIGNFLMNHPLLSAAGTAALIALTRKMFSSGDGNSPPNLKNPNTIEGSIWRNITDDPLKTLETVFLPTVMKTGARGWAVPLIESYKIWQNTAKGDYHKSMQGANLLYNFMRNPKAGALVSLAQFLGVGPLQKYLEQNMDYVVNDPLLGKHEVHFQLPADDVYEGFTNMGIQGIHAYTTIKKYMDFAKVGTDISKVKDIQKIFSALKTRHPLFYRDLVLAADGTLMKMAPGSAPKVATALEQSAFRTGARGEIVRGIGKTGKALGIAGGILEGGMYGVQAYNEFKQGNVGYGMTRSAQAFIALAGTIALYAAPVTFGTSLLITAALVAVQFIIDAIVTCFKIKEKIEAQDECENVRKMFLDVNFWTRENIKHVKEFDKITIKYQDKKDKQRECIKELSDLYKAYLAEVGTINKISSATWRSDKEFLDEYKDLIKKIKQLTLLIKINGGNDPNISKKDYEKKTNAVALTWDSKEIQNMFAQLYKNWVLNREKKDTEVDVDGRTKEDEEITEIFDPTYNSDMDFLQNSDIPAHQKGYFIRRRQLINRSRIDRYKSFNKEQQEYLKERRVAQEYQGLSSYDTDNPNASNIEELVIPDGSEKDYNVARLAIHSSQFLDRIGKNTSASFSELNIQAVNKEYRNFFTEENLKRSTEDINKYHAYIIDALSDSKFIESMKKDKTLSRFNTSLDPNNWVPDFYFFGRHIDAVNGPQRSKINKLVGDLCHEYNIMKGNRWPEFCKRYVVTRDFKNSIFKTFKSKSITKFTGKTLSVLVETNYDTGYWHRLMNIWSDNSVNTIQTYTSTYRWIWEFMEDLYLRRARQYTTGRMLQYEFDNIKAEEEASESTDPFHLIGYAQAFLIKRYLQYIVSSGQVANSDYVKASKSFIIPDNNTAPEQRINEYLLQLQGNRSDKSDAIHRLVSRATSRLLGVSNPADILNPNFGTSYGAFKDLDFEKRVEYKNNIFDSLRDIEQTFGINLQDPNHMDTAGGILFQSVLDNDELTDELITALNAPIPARSMALEAVRSKALQKFAEQGITTEGLQSEIEKLILEKAKKFPKKAVTDEDVAEAKREVEEYKEEIAQEQERNSAALASNTVAIESNNAQLLSINETLRDIKTYTLSKEAMVYDRNIFMRSVDAQVKALEAVGATKEQIAALLPTIYKTAATKPDSVFQDGQNEQGGQPPSQPQQAAKNAAGGVTTEYATKAKYEPEDNAIWGEAGPEYRFTNLLGQGSHFYLPTTLRPGNMLDKITKATAAKLNANGSYNAWGPNDPQGQEAIEAISTEVSKNLKNVGFKPSELTMFAEGGTSGKFGMFELPSSSDGSLKTKDRKARAALAQAKDIEKLKNTMIHLDAALTESEEAKKVIASILNINDILKERKRELSEPKKFMYGGGTGGVKKFNQSPTQGGGTTPKQQPERRDGSDQTPEPNAAETKTATASVETNKILGMNIDPKLQQMIDYLSELAASGSEQAKKALKYVQENAPGWLDKGKEGFEWLKQNGGALAKEGLDKFQQFMEPDFEWKAEHDEFSDYMKGKIKDEEGKTKEKLEARISELRNKIQNPNATFTKDQEKSLQDLEKEIKDKDEQKQRIIELEKEQKENPAVSHQEEIETLKSQVENYEDRKKQLEELKKQKDAAQNASKDYQKARKELEFLEGVPIYDQKQIEEEKKKNPGLKTYKDSKGEYIIKSGTGIQAVRDKKSNIPSHVQDYYIDEYSNVSTERNGSNDLVGEIKYIASSNKAEIEKKKKELEELDNEDQNRETEARRDALRSEIEALEKEPNIHDKIKELRRNVSNAEEGKPREEALKELNEYIQAHEVKTNLTGDAAKFARDFFGGKKSENGLGREEPLIETIARKYSGIFDRDKFEAEIDSVISNVKDDKAREAIKNAAISYYNHHFAKDNGIRDVLEFAKKENERLTKASSERPQAVQPDRNAPSPYEEKKKELEERTAEGAGSVREEIELEEAKRELKESGPLTPEIPEEMMGSPTPPPIISTPQSKLPPMDRTEKHLIKSQVIYPQIAKNVSKFITYEHLNRTRYGSQEFDDYVDNLIRQSGITDEDTIDHIKKQARSTFTSELLRQRRLEEKRLGIGVNDPLPEKVPSELQEQNEQKKQSLTQLAQDISVEKPKPNLEGIEPPKANIPFKPNLPEPDLSPFKSKEDDVHTHIADLENRFRKSVESSQFTTKAHLSDHEIGKAEGIRERLKKDSKYLDDKPEEKVLYDKYLELQRLEELGKKGQLSDKERGRLEKLQSSKGDLTDDQKKELEQLLLKSAGPNEAESKELETLRGKYRIPLESLVYTAGLDGLNSKDTKTSLLLDRFIGSVWSHDKGEQAAAWAYKKDLGKIQSSFLATDKGKKISAFRDQYLKYAQGRYDEDYKLDRINALREKYKDLKQWTAFPGQFPDRFFVDYAMSGKGIYRNPEQFLEHRKRELDQLQFKEIMEGDGGKKSTAYVGSAYGKDSKEYRDALAREETIKSKYAKIWDELKEFYTLQDAYYMHSQSTNDLGVSNDSVYFEPSGGMSMAKYGEDFLKLNPELAQGVNYTKGSLFHKASVSMDEPYMTTQELEAKLASTTPPPVDKSSSQAVGEAAGMAKAVAESPKVREQIATTKPVKPLSELASEASDELKEEAEARDIDGNPMDESRYEHEKQIAEGVANEVGVIEAAGGMTFNLPGNKKDKDVKKFAKGGVTKKLADGGFFSNIFNNSVLSAVDEIGRQLIVEHVKKIGLDKFKQNNGYISDFLAKYPLENVPNGVNISNGDTLIAADTDIEELLRGKKFTKSERENIYKQHYNATKIEQKEASLSAKFAKGGISKKFAEGGYSKGFLSRLFESKEEKNARLKKFLEEDLGQPLDPNDLNQIIDDDERNAKMNEYYNDAANKIFKKYNITFDKDGYIHVSPDVLDRSLNNLTNLTIEFSKELGKHPGMFSGAFGGMGPGDWLVHQFYQDIAKKMNDLSEKEEEDYYAKKASEKEFRPFKAIGDFSKNLFSSDGISTDNELVDIFVKHITDVGIDKYKKYIEETGLFNPIHYMADDAPIDPKLLPKGFTEKDINVDTIEAINNRLLPLLGFKDLGFVDRLRERSRWHAVNDETGKWLKAPVGSLIDTVAGREKLGFAEGGGTSNSNAISIISSLVANNLDNTSKFADGGLTSSLYDLNDNSSSISSITDNLYQNPSVSQFELEKFADGGYTETSEKKATITGNKATIIRKINSGAKQAANQAYSEYKSSQNYFAAQDKAINAFTEANKELLMALPENVRSMVSNSAIKKIEHQFRMLVLKDLGYTGDGSVQMMFTDKGTAYLGNVSKYGNNLTAEEELAKKETQKMIQEQSSSVSNTTNNVSSTANNVKNEVVNNNSSNVTSMNPETKTNVNSDTSLSEFKTNSQATSSESSNSSVTNSAKSVAQISSSDEQGYFSYIQENIKSIATKYSKNKQSGNGTLYSLSDYQKLLDAKIKKDHPDWTPKMIQNSRNQILSKYAEDIYNQHMEIVNNSNVSSVNNSMGDKISQSISSASSSVGSFFGDMFSSGANIVNKGVSSVSKVANGVVQGGSSVINKAGSMVSKGVSGVVQGGSSVINKAGSMVSNGVTGIVNSTSNARNAVIGGIQNGISNVGGAVNNIASGISNGISNIQSPISNIVNNVSNAKSSVLGGIQNAVGSAGNAIGNIGSSVANGIQKGIAVVNGQVVPNYNMNPRTVALNTESMSTVSESRTTEGTGEQIENQLQKSLQAINSSNMSVIKNIKVGGSSKGGTVINNYDADHTYRMIESVGNVK